MEVVSIEDLEAGDVILIAGMEENEICIVTVEKVLLDEYLIIPEEFGGMDYSPEQPEKITRLATKQSECLLSILAPIAFR